MNRKFCYLLPGVLLTLFYAGAIDAASQPHSDMDALIVKTIQETLYPYEREMDLSINGRNGFSSGFVNEYKKCPHDGISEIDLQEYLPNFILRVVAQKMYVNEMLGKYCAVQFLRSVTQRKLCGPSLLSESQSLPIKNTLMNLWEETESILNPYNFNELKSQIYNEIRILIGRAKQSLCDPTYVSAPVNFDRSTTKKIMDDFRSIVSDLMNLEITNQEMTEKYATLLGPLGGLSPALDQQPDEFRLAVRMHHLPVIFALLFDQNLKSRSEFAEKRHTYEEKLRVFLERKKSINREIEIHEMSLFGHSVLSSEKNAMTNALDNYLLNY